MNKNEKKVQDGREEERKFHFLQDRSLHYTQAKMKGRLYKFMSVVL